MQNALTGMDVDDKSVKGITELVQELLDLEIQITSKQAHVAALMEKYDKLSKALIPDAMTEAGVTELTLTGGFEVRINKFYSASIKDDTKVEAFKWLRGHNHDGLIKSEVNIVIPRGEQELLAKADKLLTKAKIPHECKDSVHHSTLKAWVKEMIEGGKKFPQPLFNVFVGNVTKVNKPKK